MTLEKGNWSPVAVFEIRDSCANLRARGGDHTAARPEATSHFATLEKGNWSPLAVFEIRDPCANLRARGGDHPFNLSRVATDWSPLDKEGMRMGCLF